MNSQSPIYSLKFTITWIFVYGIIVFVLWQFIQIFLAIYLGLWVLNLLIEIVERLVIIRFQPQARLFLKMQNLNDHC